MNRLHRRTGFTLVELLVVASIFAMLFGMIALGARPNTRGNVRLAAQQLASVLLATQTRALGSTAGAGSPSKRARVSASAAGPRRERMARMVRRQREAMGASYATTAPHANKGPAPVVRSGPTGGRGTGAVPLKQRRR